MDEESEKMLLIAALIVAVVLTVTATAAVMSKTVMKPFVLEFTFAEPEVKAESIVFIYNAGTWMGANVTLKNYASEPRIVNVYVYIYNSNGFQIAFGSQMNLLIYGGATLNVEVPLVWEEEIQYAAFGKVVVEAT